MNAPAAVSPSEELDFPAEADLPQSQRGIYRKFDVRRTDGKDAPGEKHEHDEYFVLNLTTDKFAIPALATYARECANDYPVLACDLTALIASTVGRNDEYITVPETALPMADGSVFVVPEFQVARYIAGRGMGDIPISTASDAPWVEIDFDDAKEAAAKAGLRLISETQWLAIAYQISQQAENWTGGKVGEGSLYMGLHDGTVSEAQAATYESPKELERRWHVLANGERIYDMSGNVFQWVFDDLHGDSQGLIAEPIEADSLSLMLAPAPSMEQGTGWRPDAPAKWSGRALFRGGYWSSGASAGVFRLNRDWLGSEGGDVGFRCTKPGL